jgi:hypothetical protein
MGPREAERIVLDGKRARKRNRKDGQRGTKKAPSDRAFSDDFQLFLRGFNIFIAKAWEIMGSEKKALFVWARKR